MKRILIVEDDDAIRRLIAAVLQRNGLEVLEETTSEGAVAKLEADEADAVILDLMILPHGGASVLDWMEEERKDLLSKTIVVSAAMPHEIDMATRGRACSAIPKPFDIEQLVRTVFSCLGIPAPVGRAGK
ncbi:MAG: response regulator [Thermoanaerobaculia bacterium]